MPRLLALQVLRAAAALSVAVLHGRYEATFLPGAATSEPAAAPWLPWAAGVDVFFVISGFVMVRASRPLYGMRGARAVFAVRRVARVAPLYWLVTTLYLALALAAPGALNGAVLTPGFVAASYLFIPAARPDGIVQPLYGLGWTLNFEMAFYALFAALLGLSRRAATVTLLGLLAGLAALGRLAPILGHPWPEPIATWTDPLLLEFGAGALLGLVATEGFRLALPIRCASGALSLALLAAAASGPEPAGFARFALYGVPAALAVAACAFGPERPETGASRPTRWASALGDASYALYLTHPFALRGARTLAAASGAGAGLAGGPFLVAALALACLAALAVHRFVERPLTRASRRMLEAAIGRA